jgi:hypothetical protein
MVIRMGWLSKLLGPVKSEDAPDALEAQYAAEAAKPPSDEPPISEPVEPNDSEPTQPNDPEPTEPTP